MIQVFEYLKALHALRSPAERQIGKLRWSMWLEDLPDHPSVRLVDMSGRRDSEGTSEVADVLLAVRRPKLTDCPPPPDVLHEWLETGWKDPQKEASARTSLNRVGPKNQTFVEKFDDDASRPLALQAWLSHRSTWTKNELPARAAMHCFERLYQLHGLLEREGETHELVVGNGLLSWQVEDGSIFHPVHLQAVQLTFNSHVPEFVVQQTDAPPELCTGLFTGVSTVEGRVLANAREELKAGGYHPLAELESKAFLSALAARLAANGEFIETKPDKERNFPTIGLAPVLFLRSRAQGFAAAIDEVLDSLVACVEMPTALVRIVGVQSAELSTPETPSSEPSSGSPLSYDSLLFSKPANEEQYRIAASLEQQSCVLVQGPPGTGKSHTIANLIGHLLAKGNRILVTAHTTKALRVLRDQVVEALRPLCVSVLDDELASRRELEFAVSAIVERLSRSDAAKLGRERDDLAKQRAQLVAKVRAAEQRVVEARATEYRQIVVGGESYEPSQAARRLAHRQRADGWVPGSVLAGAPLSLSESEIGELYASTTYITAADELELRGVLPDLEALLTPSEFEAFVLKRTRMERLPRDFRPELWSGALVDADEIEALAEKLNVALTLLPEEEPWRRAAALAAFAGGDAAELWVELIAMVENLAATARRSQGARMQYGPSLGDEDISDETAATLEEIAAHLEQGGSLSSIKLLFNPTWREVIRVARVDGEEPRRSEHFRALIAVVELGQQRRALRGRWTRQVAALGGPTSAELGDEIESTARQYAHVLRDAMMAGETLWQALGSLERLGLNWDRTLASEAPCHGPTGEIDRIVNAIERGVLQQFIRRANAFRWAIIEDEARLVRARISDFASNHPASAVLRALEQSLIALDSRGYRSAYERLTTLLSKRSTLVRRQTLLESLRVVASDWATAIENREGVHGGGAPPGNAGDAWLYSQLADEITRRQRLSLERAQQELEQARADLRRVTADLSDRAAWQAQTKRTSLVQRQALIGWMDTVKRIGKGTGKRAGALRSEAQRLMAQAAEAVPVWVMPLSRVVHSFDPSRPAFDVVIIDEASQMDVLGLIAIYLGKKVIVVGDHEQVSPLAVGQDVDAISKLIAEHLRGIPNAHLYDGRQSVYDMARQSFGGTIRLVEHFRCVPQIIEFSNWLSYGGDIKPLREAASSRLVPHVVPHRLESFGVERKVNHLEAMEIVSLIVAASEDPAYGGKSFGVVSLVGDEQAEFIDSQLRKRMSPDEHTKRRLVCGNPSQFQGDERDVMWLSVVDVPEDGPLRMRSDQSFQQRYNVAASRARDQMWVVYSLDPAVDLKPEDLRRRLIEHALNPNARTRVLQRAENQVESEFERQVLRRLHSRGYCVRPQWEVGHYRIDLVVEGSGKRLAVECDGDRYHTVENLQQDLARQATLERLGWRFVRIRGTHFFQDPDGAMKLVFAALEALGIPPELDREAASTAGPVHQTDLRDRVVRRASEIRRAWEEEARARDEIDVNEQVALT